MSIRFWRRRSLPASELSVFVATARRAFLFDNPNPQRKGCPDRQSLRDLAFRKADKEATMEATQHLRHCSDCFREVSEYVKQFNSHRALSLKLAVAAGIALIIVASLFVQTHFRKSKSEQVSRSPSSEKIEPQGKQPERDGTQISRVGTALPIVDFIVLSPTRGAERAKTETLTLTGERLRLRIHLPLGSEAGEYEIRLHQKANKKEILRVARKATKENNYTLTVEEDFGKFPRGSYLLAIFPPGWNEEVQAHPVEIVSIRAN